MIARRASVPFLVLLATFLWALAPLAQADDYEISLDEVHLFVDKTVVPVGEDIECWAWCDYTLTLPEGEEEELEAGGEGDVYVREIYTWNWDGGKATSIEGDHHYKVNYSASGNYTIQVTCTLELRRVGTDELLASAGPESKTVDVTVYEATLRVRRKGSGDDYAGSATVAAGKLSSDVHKADIEVSTDPAVQGVTLNTEIKVGEGLGQAGTDGEASVYIGSTTDENGKITGTYMSSNKSENVTLELRYQGQDVLDTATVSQAWDDAAGLEFNVPYYFVPEIADTCKFTCRLQENVPIDGHTIKWYTTRIELDWYWWNIDTDEADWDEQEYDYPFTGDDDLPFDQEIGDFIAYSGGQEDPAGVYAKTHTVYDYFDIVEIEGEDVWQEALVTEYDFAVYDDGVYIAD